MLNGKRILITGGTGSIGNYLITQMCSTNVQSIIVFSRDEEKQYYMKQRIIDPRVEYIIGDIKDYYRLNNALYDVNYVIHAAAMKQVPIAEMNPIEAVATNIMGTENVLQCSIQQKVEKVICLSSDKAISPSNCMGMTKGICERLVRSFNPSVQTKISCVRLGNVLGSKGSVIPTWKDQISRAHSIFLTDINMTRFIMTLDNVYQLIMHAIQFGQHREIIFSNMKSCNIYDIARAMCIYYGLDPEETVHIIGIREGEKLYEEVFSEEERNHIYENNGYYHISRDVFPLFSHIPRKSDECEKINMEQLTDLLANTDLL